eukprot:COSAG04_NODE_18106_length_451_cov_0.531250_1_plen_125_part_10
MNEFIPMSSAVNKGRVSRRPHKADQSPMAIASMTISLSIPAAPIGIIPCFLMNSFCFMMCSDRSRTLIDMPNVSSILACRRLTESTELYCDNSNSVRLVRGYVRADQEGPGKGQRLERQAGQAGE